MVVDGLIIAESELRANFIFDLNFVREFTRASILVSMTIFDPILFLIQTPLRALKVIIFFENVLII
jgi:hypothetical protein